MQAQIDPVAAPLNGRMKVPGSKSLTNRALICASLAKGRSELLNASDSDDTSLMANGLNLLGIVARQIEGTLVVEGTGGVLAAPRFPIPVGNAGTTFRFLLSMAALASGTTRFELSQRMAERPIDDLVEALTQLGIIVKRDTSGLFINVQGGGVQGGRVVMRGDRSSQFLSSLLLTSPLGRRDISIVIDGALSSKPYVDMTIDVMKYFGAHVTSFDADERRYEIRGNQHYHPTKFRIESDASGASYPFAAAAIAGGSMRVEGMPRDSLQGDARFLETLTSMGCQVEETATALEVRRTGSLKGIEVDMNSMPDVVPSLVAVALFAEGPTWIRNVGHLRFKESNRLETLAVELGKCGARIEVLDDGLLVHPCPLHGARASSHDDHRLAMTFALIGLRIPGIIIEEAECVKKSFPAFWDEFSSITKIVLSNEPQG